MMMRSESRPQKVVPRSGLTGCRQSGRTVWSAMQSLDNLWATIFPQEFSCLREEPSPMTYLWSIYWVCVARFS